mmetsp:Transcript_14752/g.21070  ORF Transcript_14752/g.21070 Transcript_14752/m.21070 type:complete len:609 (+) Transcript_14752:112-1938(+)|eukprot:CAMPEP_0184865026 /NCGR_PEP_ID=MMETSP0580-20130426/16652_1 /TAXON_ID=1118495 /ORGANISM="Dactyliosolen fragilissimus" /LENGTH=608 /DNA_ID=CAMNT_0027364021 /DNA_START=63 /DNA_END=1889 /DNA_ORIENTATION=+
MAKPSSKSKNPKKPFTKNDFDAETVNATNESKDIVNKKKLAKLKSELEESRAQCAKEKNAKRKLYTSLVKIAQELKNTRHDCRSLIATNKFYQKPWYDGGVVRGPQLLPSVGNTISARQRARRDPISLSDLFFDLVIVTAFSRVGKAIQNISGLNGTILAYFAIFWLIWGKEASYSTRFDTSDISSRLCTLLTCFAVLLGSISTTSSMNSKDGSRIMFVAGFVSILHFLLHLRVWFWFRNEGATSDLSSVKGYAVYIMVTSFLEICSWAFGIFFLPETSPHRYLVFLVAILFSFRLPKSFLSNDFHAACSKRGVLFLLLLGFTLQNIVLVCSPFIDYQLATPLQYTFLALACFLLFTIKLLYVDDSSSLDPKDHALLVNRFAGFFFHIGQFALLFSTVVLGAGLQMSTQNYFAAVSALPQNTKSLVYGGFSGVILSIAFIKSMHIRRLPTKHLHKWLFFAAYGIQILVLIAIAYCTISITLDKDGFIGHLILGEVQMLAVLCGFALFLLLMSFLDEAVELSLYGSGDVREFRIHPFGFWVCLKADDPEPLFQRYSSADIDDERLSHLSPLLSKSNANLFGSQKGMYGTTNEEKLTSVTEDDDIAMNAV